MVCNVQIRSRLIEDPFIIISKKNNKRFLKFTIFSNSGSYYFDKSGKKKPICNLVDVVICEKDINFKEDLKAGDRVLVDGVLRILALQYNDRKILEISYNLKNYIPTEIVDEENCFIVKCSIWAKKIFKIKEK